MTVVFPERVSLSIYRYGIFEPDLSLALVRLLEPGMTFYDVGAHIGYFSRLASRLVGPAGQVHSFEPTNATYHVLHANLSGVPGSHANEAAVHRRNGTLSFTQYDSRFSAFNTASEARLEEEELAQALPRTVSVRSTSLDDYVSESGAPPHFVKIDAEGAEREILLGARETLEHHRPMLAMEVGDVGGTLETVSRRLIDETVDLGYTAYEVAARDLRVHHPQERYEYQNLIFLPRLAT